jgi:hypothetical protein
MQNISKSCRSNVRKHNNTIIKFSFMIILLINISPVNSQQIEQHSSIKTDYLIYFPPNYNVDQNEKWPLMIYLHGAGLREYSMAGLKDDYMPWHLEHDKILPFIVVSPLGNTNGWDITILNFLLENLIQKYKVNENKIYLMGHSMGGFGTWNWAIMNPEKFAAIVPVSGCSNSIDILSAWKLRNMPIWVFHGQNDKIVDIHCNIEMVNELNKFSKKVKFCIYPDRGHDTWEPTFSNDEMYKWLLEQDMRNNKPVPIKLDNEIYIKYSGKYLLNKDTLTIGYDGEKLFLQPSVNEKVTLIPETEISFSIEGSPFIGIMFQKDDNVIKGFFILEKSKMFASKISIK